MTIRTRLLVSYIWLSLVFMGVSVYQMLSLREISGTVDHLSETNVVSLVNINNLNSAIKSFRYSLGLASGAGVQNDKTLATQLGLAQERVDEFDKFLLMYKTAELSQEEVVLSDKLADQWTQIKTKFESLSQTPTSARSKELASLLDEVHAVDGTVENLAQIQNDQSYLWSTRAKARSKSAMMIVGVATAVLFFGSMLYALWFSSRISKSLLSVVDKIFVQLGHLTASSKSIGQTTEELVASAGKQAAALSQAAASIDETSSMLIKTAEQSQEGLSLAQKGLKSANEGIGTIEKLVESMNVIDSSNQSLEQLVKITEEIKSKTKVINDIVFETRLLAFNASIEAARAGAHGKGFAVVADEVGKLANVSGQSADEIHGLLNKSMTDVKQTVDLTKTRIFGILEISKQCEQSFRTIQSNTELLTQAVHSIAAASDEQKIGIQETSKAMGEIELVTQKNSSNADHLNEQLSSLANVADEVNNAVEELSKLIVKKSAQKKSRVPRTFEAVKMLVPIFRKGQNQKIAS